MRLLFLGDMVGRSGRTAVWERLPGLVSDFGLDFVIVNGENAAGGFGITEEIFLQTIDAGADVVTTGNHVWNQREALVFCERYDQFLRPANFPEGTPGRGIDARRCAQRGARAGRQRHGPGLHASGAGRSLRLRRPAARSLPARRTGRRRRLRLPRRGDQREAVFRPSSRRAGEPRGRHPHACTRPPTASSSPAEPPTCPMPACAATTIPRSAWTRKSRLPASSRRSRGDGSRPPPARRRSVASAWRFPTGRDWRKRIAPLRLGPRLVEAMPHFWN